MKNPETANWEYIKDRLFDGKTSNVYKRKNGILIVSPFASKEDSLLIRKAILKIKKILPEKDIAFFKDFTGISYEDVIKNKPDTINGYKSNYILGSIVFLSFSKGSGSPLNRYFPGATEFFTVEEDGTMDTYGSVQHHFSKDKNGLVVGWPRINFQTIENTWSRHFDESIICYELMRLLCHIQNISISVPEESIYSSTEHRPMEHSILNRDIFLLQKLYSDNFLNQFEEYLFAHYPSRFASAFLNKKISDKKAMIFVTGIGLLVFISVFVLFYNKKFKYSFLNYFLPILFFWLCLTNLVWIYDYFTSFNTVVGLDDIFGFQFIALPIFALITAGELLLLEKYTINNELNFSIKLMLHVVYTFVAFLTPLVLVFFTKRGNESFFDFFFPIFYIVIGVSLGRGILIYLNHSSESLVKQKDVELSRLKEMNAQSELKLLQSHINPHFLYNALNSIAGLAHSNADKTEKMALSLSDLFRYTINKKGEQMSTVGEEVTMVKNYLDIEKIRFGDRLNFLLNIDVTIMDISIPMYILQPLVENAIKHGISKISGEAKIGLEIIKEKEDLLISVSDNGPDFPKGLVSGHGLQTVNDLLRLSYGENASLKWENTPEKKITISIPKIV